MRQVLLFFRLDDLFSLEPIENVMAIGAGWLLIPGALVGLWMVVRAMHHKPIQLDDLTPMFFGLAVAIGIFSLPWWAPVKSIPVYGYGFMLFVAFLLAVQMATWRLQSEGLGSDFVWDLAMWIFFSGIVGSRLFYVIQYRDVVFAGKQGYFEHVLAAVNLPNGGLTLFGGVILASIAAIVFLNRYCRRHNLTPLYLADVIVPSLFVGIACGRLGCFLNGCCYGDRCDLIWAVTFPNGSVAYQSLQFRGLLPPDALASLPLHPTQIYSSLNAVVIAVLTTVYFRYRTRNGAVVALALIVYPISRFVIEILRWDESAKWDTGLTISQLVSLFVFAIGLAMAGWCFTTDRPAVKHLEGTASADAPASA